MKHKQLLSVLAAGCISLLLTACYSDKESDHVAGAEPAAAESMADKTQASVGQVIDNVEEVATEAKEMAEATVSDAVTAGQEEVGDALSQAQEQMVESGTERLSDEMKNAMEGEVKLP